LQPDILRTAEQEIDALMQLHPKGFDLSLDRISKLLERLGNPHLKLPPVIHIAGTNGKGSASAFSRAILEAAGFSVHVHTSPHLVRWHERYRMGAVGGGTLVDDRMFADALRRVAKENAGQQITVFEILTAAGFLLFSENPADVVILEVGLGGRFDATNVIAKPAVSLIMPVSMDHEAYLGDTPEKIAFEKGGIIKRGCPVVIGQQPFSAAKDMLIALAEKAGGPLAVYGQEFLAYEEHGRMVYQDEDGLSDLPLPALIGRHQIANAAAAIKAVQMAGFDVPDDAVERGLMSASWPARMQRLRQGELLKLAPKGAEIWLDGGHNPGAGIVVAEALAGQDERSERPLFMIAGMINTKDSTGYFRAFEGLVKHVYAVPVSDSDAGVAPEKLALAAQDAGLSAEPVASIANALALLRNNFDPDETPPRILIGGSLYLAGEVLRQNGTIPE
jgi:dihydrofolate synthase / folylpolyglutamate synthase